MLPFLDMFVGVNGTHLAAHTPDVGGPWLDDTPGWQIESNHAQQMVDSADSHVESGGKILAMAAVVNVNGIDASNLLNLWLADDAGANGVKLSIFNLGNISVNMYLATANAADMDTFDAPLLFDPTQDVMILLAAGPDVMTFRQNGRVLWQLPRIFAKTFSFTRFRLQCGALNAKPGPIVKQLSVS
jgi:hypothetical protein